MWVVPINGQSNPSCVGLGFCRHRLQEHSGAPNSLDVSCQCLGSCLVWPIHKTNRSFGRVINVKSVGHMNEGHSKMHWYQLDVGLILIKDHCIDSSFGKRIWQGLI